MDGKLCSSGEEEQMVRICLYVYVCVAPSMIVGVWSMAVMLWQLYYYYYYYLHRWNYMLYHYYYSVSCEISKCLRHEVWLARS